MKNGHGDYYAEDLPNQRKGIDGYVTRELYASSVGHKWWCIERMLSGKLYREGRFRDGQVKCELP